MLPEKICPIQLVKLRAELNGQISIQNMTRLAEFLFSEPKDEVHVKLEFTRNEEGLPIIEGLISGKIILICQRCGEGMPFRFAIETYLSPVLYESEAWQLPSEYEPLVTHGELVNLQNMIEDEILLSLPMIPQHCESECSVNLPYNIL